MSAEELSAIGLKRALPCNSESDAMMVSRLGTLLQQEREHYGPCFDYLSMFPDLNKESNEYVTEAWRRKMCEWAFQVVDHFCFDRECVSIAMFYMDRVIADRTRRTGEPVSTKGNYKYIPLVCLYLAIKLHGETFGLVEGAPRKLRISAFVELSRKRLSIEDIEKLEWYTFPVLGWYINPPTVAAFLASFLRLLPKRWNDKQLNVHCAIFETARYLSELSLCISSHCFYYTSSEIAYACILCAINALRNVVHFPPAARNAFLVALSEHTSFTPDNETIQHACEDIMEVCPSLDFCPLFPETLVLDFKLQSSCDESIGNTAATAGKPRNAGRATSPVCVLDIDGLQECNEHASSTSTPFVESDASDNANAEQVVVADVVAILSNDASDCASMGSPSDNLMEEAYDESESRGDHDGNEELHVAAVGRLCNRKHSWIRLVATKMFPFLANCIGND